MRADVAQWARVSLAHLCTFRSGAPWDDLSALGSMIGDSSVVALSEGVHCATEPLEFRNRLLQYLVERKGFTAIAIESGMIEGRVVHDYVRGEAGDLPVVLSRGISWGGDQLPQNRALVSWLRACNAKRHDQRKINFYGFDVSGSPAAGRSVRRGHDTALNEVLEWLNSVDGSAGALFRVRARPFMHRMHFTVAGNEAGGYATLSQDERGRLTALVGDIMTMLERNEARYTQATSASDYQWAHRAAMCARQMDEWLRETPIGWRSGSEDAMLRFFAAATDTRDRAQADNLEWILRQEGEGGKVLVFAARYHLSAAPLKVRFVPNGVFYSQTPAGTYLRERLGGNLVTIGNLLGGGLAGCCGYQEVLQRPPADSVDGLAAELGVPLFLLDLRDAPPSVRTWLNHGQHLVSGGQTLQLAVCNAFDILFYIDAVTPACSP